MVFVKGVNKGVVLKFMTNDKSIYARSMYMNYLYSKFYKAMSKPFFFSYLAGKCSKSNCLLSHDTSAAKMPICLHYLAGVCGRDNCIYPHIKHNANVSVCKIFLRGYCEKAEKVCVDTILYVTFPSIIK